MLAPKQGLANAARPLADFIPYSTHVSNFNVRTVAGDTLTVIKLAGVAHECADDEDIQGWHDALTGLLRNIATDLERVWKEATLVAALAYSIGSRCQLNADESMLAGLLHNVGKLYILARANRHGSLFRDPAALGQVMRDWHANVGKAIVENWGFPEHIAEAIGEHENIDRQAGQADVADVLTVAAMSAGFVGQDVDFELNMQGVKAFSRLHLDNAKCADIVQNCGDEISALRSALGD